MKNGVAVCVLLSLYIGVTLGLLLRIKIIWLVTQLKSATELPVIPSALHFI